MVRWINRRLFPSRLDLFARWAKNAWKTVKRCLARIFPCCTGNGSGEVARQDGFLRSAERRLSRIQRIERKQSKRKKDRVTLRKTAPPAIAKPTIAKPVEKS